MRPGRKRRQTFDLRTEREICGMRSEGRRKLRQIFGKGKYLVWEGEGRRKNIVDTWNASSSFPSFSSSLQPGFPLRGASQLTSALKTKRGDLWKFYSRHVLSLWPDNYGHTSHGSGEDDFGEVPHFCFNCLQRGPLIEVNLWMWNTWLEGHLGWG